MDNLINTLEKTLDPVEVIELLKDFTFDQEELNKYAVKNMVCPKCCGDLKWDRWREDRGEYMGFKAEEEVRELRCESCHWVDE